jgi:arginine utilization regulatory protein
MRYFLSLTTKAFYYYYEHEILTVGEIATSVTMEVIMKGVNSNMIEALNQENESLKSENQLLMTLLDQIHETVFVTNEADEIIIYNRQAEIHEGLKREEVLGKKEAEVYTNCEYNFNEEVTKKVQTTGKPMIDQYYRYKLPDGRITDFIFSAFPFYYKGKLTAVYSIGRNINQISEFIVNTFEIPKKNSRESNSHTKGAKYLLDDIIGTSEKILETVSLARKVATHDSPILIVGETGTGKELFAHGIHNASLYAQGLFVPINCAAIPDTLLESVLFGTVKGAFTGAMDIPGLFEQAENGTIFLDEINSMPFSLQAKILRVIQEKVVRRVGSITEIPINCRIISATNVDPAIAIKERLIRPDLFFRLATIAINIPPLRERKDDIKLISNYFVNKFNAKFGLFIQKISDELIKLLENYSWPGNIRELENVIESAMNSVEVNDRILNINHVYCKERFYAKQSFLPITTNNGTLRNALLECEKGIIELTLRKNNGNITKTAAELSLSRQNLYLKLRLFKKGQC